MAESKVQKVARKRDVPPWKPDMGACGCGGALYWGKVSPQQGKARMRKVCEACGAIHL